MQRVTVKQSSSVGSVLLLATLMILVAPVKFSWADYYAAGSVGYVVCDGGLGTETFSEEVPGTEGRTEVSLATYFAFENGNEAEARTSSCLASATLRTFAAAQYVDPNSYWHTSGEARASIRDTLVFQLAPGHYADGAVVTVSGYLNGSLESVGSYPGTHSKVTCQASFSGQEYEFASDVDVEADEYFELSTPLITPGSTLGETLDRPAVIFAALFAEAQVKPGEVSSAWSDFGGTFRFTGISVPEGVSWTSDSGLFLTVPEPSSLAFFGLGVVALLIWICCRHQTRSWSQRRISISYSLARSPVINSR